MYYVLSLLPNLQSTRELPPKHEPRCTTEVKADTQEAQLWIRQDFQRSASDEDNAYEQLSCASLLCVA
jgi:hypothetical protein